MLAEAVATYDRQTYGLNVEDPTAELSYSPRIGQ